VENIYYRFMFLFIKKISLFLLTLVSNKILSMLSWLIDCKFLQRISKEHKLRVKSVKICKDLKLTIVKYVLQSNFCAINMNDVDVILGYPWMPTIGTYNINVEKKFIFGTRKRKLHCRMCLLIKKKGPWRQGKKLLQSPKWTLRLSLQKYMKQIPRKDTTNKPRRSLTQRNTMLQS
jgi:hypothetical protein